MRQVLDDMQANPASAHKHMQVLPREYAAEFDDFRAVFGERADGASYQSAEIASSSERSHVRLIGRRHDLLRWSCDASFRAPNPFSSNPLAQLTLT